MYEPGECLPDTLTGDLRRGLTFAEPTSVGILSGKLLEEICNQLTWRMSIPIARNRDDRYTLGDLWPPVRQRLAGTNADSIVRAIATQRGIRNVSSHAEAISVNLSSAEASSFAKAVLELYGHVHCIKCRSWIKGSVSPSCSCGAVELLGDHCSANCHSRQAVTLEIYTHTEE